MTKDKMAPRPTVRSQCKICLGPRNPEPLPAQMVISPRGVLHHGIEDGHTFCGHDATGGDWWWPL